MQTWDQLDTPCLLLERARMERNIRRLAERMQRLGVGLRPHLKTAKCWEVAERMLPTPAGPATVSTLREAEEFAARGVRDMTYAVGIAPQKLARVAALRARGCDLSVIVDSLEQALAVAAHGRTTGAPIPALIEIDADGHRSGVGAGDTEKLTALGRALHSRGAQLRGVLTHAGGSYDARGVVALAGAAEGERAAAVAAANALRAAGLACPVVSVGSTPTAHFAASLEGVTEVRAGVYVFFDLMMLGLGVCELDDIACSVLATVIGHQPAKGWTLTDAGWMALSRDRGDGSPGYGQVCDLEGRPYARFVVLETSQEHGVLAALGGPSAPQLPVGARVRILPNHACATAAQFDRYHVVGTDGTIEAIWPRFNHW